MHDSIVQLTEWKEEGGREASYQLTDWQEEEGGQEASYQLTH